MELGWGVMLRPPRGRAAGTAPGWGAPGCSWFPPDPYIKRARCGAAGIQSLFWVSRRGSYWMWFSLVPNLQAFGGEKKPSFRYITYALGKEDIGKHFQILNCLDSELYY